LAVARIIGTAILFLAVLTPMSGLAADHITPVSEQPGRLVVDVSFDPLADAQGPVPPYLSEPGRPPLHFARFYVVVKDVKNFQVSLLDGSYRDQKGGLPQPDLSAGGTVGRMSDRPGFFPTASCLASSPFRFRGHTVVAVDCYAQQVDYAANTRRQWSRCRVQVQFNPVTAEEAGGSMDPFLSQLVLNRISSSSESMFQAEPAVRQSPAPTFSRSNNWVKIRVTERGMYRITGSDLYAIGVELSEVDPNSLRLFTAGGVQQPRSLYDASGTWKKENWMQECAVLLRGAQDGTFDPADEIVFYGLGNRDWLDYYRPGAARDEHYEHPFSNYNVYFLTWNGSFSGGAERMETVAANPQSAPEYKTYQKREHFEKDLAEIFDYGDDGWCWLNIPPKAGSQKYTLQDFRFTVNNLVESVPQRFRTVAGAPWMKYEVNTGHHAVYLMNDAFVTEHVWSVTNLMDHFTYADFVSAESGFLREGLNQFSLSVPRDMNAKDFMYFMWFEVMYQRGLVALNDVLNFSSPDTTGTILISTRGYSTGGTLELFDVTDQYRPRILSGVSTADIGGEKTASFSTSLTGERKYFLAAKPPTYRKPAMQRVFPVDLKNVTTSPNMLIVCNALFEDAADVLAAYRRNRLPFYSSPNVSVVTTSEIFDNFSGGLTDPMALRNYCKFLYDNFTGGGGAPLLTYLLLLGDANADYRNIATSQPDYVPTNLNLGLKQAIGVGAYATDEWFVLMDIEDERAGRAAPDIAVGRLPAASTAEASFLVDKTIQYETAGDYDPWRGKAIFVADDEVYSSGKNQTQFVLQSEFIISAILPEYVDYYKIYLTEFPWVQGIKPESRSHFLKKWNEGALLINYVGHGSSISMADEQVFLAADVATLQNGDRLPMFLAMSCTIGDFDNPTSKSLAERLLLKEGGGTIGTVTASQESFIGANSQLNYGLIRNLFPETPGPPDPMGVALMLGKLDALPLPDSSQHQVENNQKYNLLGDPAVRLHLPGYEIELANNDADTLIAGVRKIIEGSVLKGGEVDTSFSGVVYLRVREPDDPSGYTTVIGEQLYYRYQRGVLFRGTAQVEKGRFSFSFRVPRFPQVGPYVYITAYAENGYRDAIVTRNTVDFALINPSPTDPIEPVDGPPHVKMGFRGGLKEVKPGAELQALVTDPDGVNILSTTNEGKLVLVFDNSNLPIDVTEFFSFDHGGSDTSGVLSYPLTNITVGEHEAVFKVSDSFGQTTIDTLVFNVTDPLAYTAEAVFNYPNPFSTSTQFLFMLSDPATIDLDIFTVSGKRIRRLQKACEAGEAWIYWDGRDETGEEIANGPYLYVARAAFRGLDRPPVVMRGKIVKIR